MVLQLVTKSGITLSPKKCHVTYRFIQALGHSVSNLGIGIVGETIWAVSEFPTPSNTKALQCFLELAVYYRRFVKDFATAASPLYSLLQKDIACCWTKACQHAQKRLKNNLVTAPIVAHPDHNKPFLLHMDTSNVGLGAAVLEQLDENNQEHPIVYLLKTLNPAEKNYTSTEMECLATVWAVKKLHAYLDGSTSTIITDHLALQWLLDFNGSNKRLVRWSMELQPYRPNMTVRNRAGRVHDNADPLSCAPLPTTNATEICNNTNSISHVEYPP
jgi:hypothetical protein